MQRINGIEVLTTVEELVVPTQTAVIVIDMQNYAISAQGGPARAGEDISQLVAMAPRLQNLLHSAREAGVLVTYAEHIMQNSLGANLSAAPMLYQLQLRPDYSGRRSQDAWDQELDPDRGLHRRICARHRGRNRAIRLLRNHHPRLCNLLRPAR